MALDVSSELLMKPLPSPLPVIPCVSSGQEDQVPSIDVYQFIIKMIIPRCSDRSPRLERESGRERGRGRERERGRGREGEGEREREREGEREREKGSGHYMSSFSVRAKALSCLTVASSCHDNKELLTIVRGAIFGSSSYPSLGTHEGKYMYMFMYMYMYMYGVLI